MATSAQTKDELREEIATLRAQLAEAIATLDAIRSGEVDALVVTGTQGAQIYTLKDADRPYRVLIEEMRQGALTVDSSGIRSSLSLAISRTRFTAWEGCVTTNFPWIPCNCW